MLNTSLEVQHVREAVLNAIISHPEKHNQAHFGEKDPECGTSMCIAGWALELTGNAIWTSCTYNDPDGVTRRVKTLEAVGYDSVSDAAQELLGLDDDEANALFFDYDNGSALLKLKHLVDTGVVPLGPEPAPNWSELGVIV